MKPGPSAEPHVSNREMNICKCIYLNCVVRWIACLPSNFDVTAQHCRGPVFNFKPKLSDTIFFNFSVLRFPVFRRFGGPIHDVGGLRRRSFSVNYACVAAWRKIWGRGKNQNGKSPNRNLSEQKTGKGPNRAPAV